MSSTPSGDVPGLNDVPRRGVIMNYVSPDVDLERELHRAPEGVKANLTKSASSDSAFQPRNSMQAWEETLYATLADGTTVTAAAEALFVPLFTLPANYLYPGRLMKWTVFGRQSTVITTPGTITHRLAYSATGLGAVVVAASGAWAPDPTAAVTTVPFMMEGWMITRSNGTSGSAFGWVRSEWGPDYDDASATTLRDALGARVGGSAGIGTPAAVTIDTTVARALMPTYQPSVATASMTAHVAFLEAVT